MKKKTRNNFFIVFLCILFGFMVFYIVKTISSNNLFYKSDEEISRAYYIEKEKYTFLKTLPQNVIVEGEGINLKEIPNKVEYEIYNNDDNIIFYYYLKEEGNISSSRRKSDSTITLSEDFHILDEEYNFTQQSLSEYMYSYKIGVDFISTFIGILSVCIFFLLIYTSFQLFQFRGVIKSFKAKKSYKISIDYKYDYKNDNK